MSAEDSVDPATRWLRLAGHVLWVAGSLALVAAVGSLVRRHAWLWSAAAMRGHVEAGYGSESLADLLDRFNDEHQWLVVALCAVPILAGRVILSLSPQVARRSRPQ